MADPHINTLRTVEANLRFCITTVKDGLHKFAFQHALDFYALNYTVHGAIFNLLAPEFGI
jgi:hypothetical protein